ncbi:hypothetical protein [Methanoregula sp.]|uniref:hypothetical protein n=1 Tax=Methanoregula sp. TaxID=2052170 RepID=UPI003C1C1191
MKMSRSYGMVICALFCIAACIMLPVSGFEVSASTANPATTTAAAVAQKPFISASASPLQPNIGDPVTISGVATGGNLTAGIQIWVFAGNYVNITTVPVNADGTFSKTYQTTGLPAATYYVIVQNPGNNGVLDIFMQTTGQFSGQVINAKTGADIFNFTGTGSIQDAAAASALSAAFNLPGVDDVFTKCTFQLVVPGAAPTSASTAAPAVTSLAPSPLPTTAKSPLSPLPLIAGIGIAGFVMAWRSRP